MKILLIPFLTLFCIVSYACDCSPTKELSEAQKKEFEFSDHVFIGEIIKVSEDEKTLTLKTKEIFKGNFKEGQIIKFQNNYYCEPFVEKPGEWLIYGKIEDGKFRMNICGLSRSLKHPEANRHFSYLPPSPVPNSTIKNVERDIEIEALIKEQRQTAIIETKRELRKLRNLKE